MLNDLSYGIYKSEQVFLQFCRNAHVCQTDGQTDGQTTFS